MTLSLFTPQIKLILCSDMSQIHLPLATPETTDVAQDAPTEARSNFLPALSGSLPIWFLFRKTDQSPSASLTPFHPQDKVQSS